MKFFSGNSQMQESTRARSTTSRREATSARFSCLLRLGKIATATAALGVLSSISGVALGVKHNSESAPHRIVGCIDGNCQPPTQGFGHYRPSWRRWPGSHVYEGFRTPGEQISLPPDEVPRPKEETRIEARTRSERPLDADQGGAAVENPFQPVPESDLPADAGQPNGLDALDADIGGLPDPGNFEPPPTDTELPGAGSDLGLPSSGPPAGGGNDIFNLDSAPSQPPSSNDDLFNSDLPGAETDPNSDDIFGPTSQLIRPNQRNLANVGATRLIKSRPRARTMTSELRDSTRQQVLKQLANASPISPVVGKTPRLPEYGALGVTNETSLNAALGLNGEFTTHDLITPGQEPIPVASPVPEIDQVAHIEPVATGDAHPTAKSFDGLKKLAVTKTPAPTEAAESRKTVPSQSKAKQTEQSQPKDIVTEASHAAGTRAASEEAPRDTDRRPEPPETDRAEQSKQTEVVYEETGNPLRPRRRVIQVKPVSWPGNANPKKLVPENNIHLKPIPKTSTPPFTEVPAGGVVQTSAIEDVSPPQSPTADVSATAAASLSQRLGKAKDTSIASATATNTNSMKESKPQGEKAKPQATMAKPDAKETAATATAQPERHPKRSPLASLSKRSLRDTLRKNPLRR